jgi:exodeoxyribonuclease-1
MTRYSLYRNFFDPYAREWQGGNSRWDLIDVVRAAYALRPMAWSGRPMTKAR